MPLQWLWILVVLLALLLLLCLTRVGVHAVFGPCGITLDANVGLLRFRLYPRVKKHKKTVNKECENTQKTQEKPTKRKFSKPSKEDIFDAVKTLWPPLKRALARTRRGIRVHPLQISFTLGAEEDPAAGAQLYGYLHAGIWTAMPILEQLLVIPDPHIHIGLDFEQRENTMKGEAGVTARIGTLLIAGVTVALPVLRWFLRYQKKQNKQPPAKATAAVS